MGSGCADSCGRMGGRVVVGRRSSTFALLAFRDGGANTLKADVGGTSANNSKVAVMESLVMVLLGRGYGTVSLSLLEEFVKRWACLLLHPVF